MHSDAPLGHGVKPFCLRIRYNFDMAPPRRMRKSPSKEAASTPINKRKKALSRPTEVDGPQKRVLSEELVTTQAVFLQSKDWSKMRKEAVTYNSWLSAMKPQQSCERNYTGTGVWAKPFASLSMRDVMKRG